MIELFINCTTYFNKFSYRHAGFIVGLMLIQPLLKNSPLWAFIIPEIFLLVTLVGGLFLQPETKGKALLDRLVEGHFGRVENEIPRTMMRYITLFLHDNYEYNYHFLVLITLHCCMITIFGSSISPTEMSNIKTNDTCRAIAIDHFSTMPPIPVRERLKANTMLPIKEQDSMTVDSETT